MGLKNDYGFVPSNYIDMQDDVDDSPASPAAAPAPPSLPSRPPAPTVDSDYSEPMASPSPPVSPAASGPAAALAGVMAGRAVPPPPQLASPPPMSPRSPQGHGYDEEEEVRSPQLPARPPSQSSAPSRSESRRQVQFHAEEEDHSGPLKVPGGFHMYNINEIGRAHV